MTLKFGQKEWFVFIILILLADLAILLNIPFLRQIIGFFFLTLLPGLLILQILKLNKIDFLEKFILAWGISISFLMFFGLLVNNLSLSLGYETPLSTIPLLISFNVAFIVLGIVGYKITKEPFFSLPNINLSTSEKAFLFVPIFFPALSIFGMYVMNTTDNNIILMFLLFLIPIYVIFVCFFNHKFPKRLYPVVIFLSSISLLLLLSLRSDHLLGDDVHYEYFFFITTLDNLHWSIAGYSHLDACLTISLLPTIYQSILNVQTEYLYKILHSVLCSVFPVIIYIISKKYVEEGYAFLASMYFMSNTTFLWTEYNARANLAMLFFAFAMMTLFNDRIEPLKKRMLFIVFMALCMVSHYSSTYAFFFVMLATFVGLEILSKKYSFKKVISLTIVVLFFALIFFWYSQVTEAAFNSGVYFVEQTFNSLFDFAVIEAKSRPAQTLLGEGVVQKSIVHKIHWVLTWITFAFIGIGVATLIRRYKEMSFPELKFKKPDFLKDKFEVVYFVLVLACSGLLVAILAIPHISKGYGLGRAYLIASTILSVFFVIGGIILSKHFFFFHKKRKPVLKEKNNCFFGKSFFSKETFMTRWDTHEHENNKEDFENTTKTNENTTKVYKEETITRSKSKSSKVFSYQRFDGKNALQNPVRKSVDGEKGLQVRAYLIILLVLIPYFLCVTGPMYNIVGVPHSVTLNSEGEQYDYMYIHDQEYYTGKWLKNNADQRNKIYLDNYMGHMSHVLSARIRISRSLLSADIKSIEGEKTDYICLGYRNVIKGKFERYNMTEYSDTFIERNRIYNNGGSEVWK